MKKVTIRQLFVRYRQKFILMIKFETLFNATKTVT